MAGAVDRILFTGRRYYIYYTPPRRRPLDSRAPSPSRAGSVAAAAGAAAAGAALAGVAVAAAALGGRLEAAGAGLGGRRSEDHGLDAAGGGGLHVRGHAACMRIGCNLILVMEASTPSSCEVSVSGIFYYQLHELPQEQLEPQLHLPLLQDMITDEGEQALAVLGGGRGGRGVVPCCL